MMPSQIKLIRKIFNDKPRGQPLSVDHLSAMDFLTQVSYQALIWPENTKSGNGRECWQ